MASDEQQIKNFVDQLNGYLGRPREYYDHKTGKYFAGSFYLDSTIDRKGKRAYRISEVLDDTGSYRSYADFGLKPEEVKIWIDGLIAGINVQRSIK